jgi:hypothetical protein
LGKQLQLRSWHVIVCCGLTLLTAVLCARTLVRGESLTTAELSNEAVSISATFSQSWQQDGETVHLLRGQCQITQ